VVNLPANAPRSARIAVVGAGWAGLAAAVAATQAGAAVTLFEMAPRLGGRARCLPGPAGSDRLDNGQHILIGAYTATLGLMRDVGVDPDRVLKRSPLALVGPTGQGLRLRHGPAPLAFALATLMQSDWRWRERLALMRHALRWSLGRFRCAPNLSVADLCHDLPPALRRDLIDPLCVAALNTPAHEASASVFLRVMHDALFSAPGAADLLVPRVPLAALLPEPAEAWLYQRKAVIHTGTQVRSLDELKSGSGQDGIVLACSANEAARLAQAINPSWARQAAAFGYEPIVTVYLDAPGARLRVPMLSLSEGPQAPAQFAFDHGAIGSQAGRFAFVISGARPWVERGREAIIAAVLQQARAVLHRADGRPCEPEVMHVVAEKRATFRCTPGLDRPAAEIAPGLVAAGDYVDGPYPATLEGAVRSGLNAARLLQG
jgi:hydroxysqualene dehydroxylase